MNTNDPFELLSVLRPTTTGDFLAPGDDPAADALLSRIVSIDPTRQSPRRRRRRLVLPVTLTFVVVASGAIATAVWLDQPTDPALLACYSEPSADPAEQFALVIDADSTPAEQCATLWQDGTFGTGEPPSLTSCVTPDGITAVMPGDATTCTALGWARLDTPLSDEQLLAPRIMSEVSGRYPTECVESVDEAETLVRTILSELRADTWRVRVERETSPDRPCAYVAIDAPNRTVLIVAAMPIER